MVKTRRATKRSAPKARKAAKKTTRTATKKSARRTKPTRAASKTGARRAKPAAGRVARGAVKKAGASKKRPASRKVPARKDFVARPVPVTTVAAGAAASASPSGEVYGEEGWREEELSAAELDTNGPELGAEPEGPEITSETDDDPEW